MKLLKRGLWFACLLMPPALVQAANLAVAVQDGAGKPLADVVVYAEAEGGGAPKAAKSAVIEQRGLKFLPLVSVVQTGASISFPNNDKVRHHIYSFSPAKKFDQKLYSGVAASSQVFDKSGTVVLGCNIHDSMVAYVKIVDTPYFAKTEADGTARFELPPGKYKLVAWHFKMAAPTGPASEQVLNVKPGDAPVAAAFKLALKAPAEGEAAGY